MSVSSDVDYAASDPCIKRPTNENIDYTAAEIRALARLVLRVRDMLQNKNELHMWDTSFWIQIANHMHAGGWPKRSWMHYWARGHRFLTGANASRQPSNLSTTHEPIPHSGLAPTTRYNAGVAGMSSSQLLSPQIVTAAATLLVSNEASATYSSTTRCTFPNLTLSADSIATPSVETALTSLPRISPVLTSPPCPQILHVCSKATHALGKEYGDTADRANSLERMDDAHNSTLSQISTTNIQYVKGSNSLDNETNRIDLSVSSDDELVHTVTHSDTDNARSSRPIGAAKRNRRRKSEQSTVRTDVARTEAQLRNLVYEKKLGILELKKRYWTEKLRVLHRQTGSPRRVANGD